MLMSAELGVGGVEGLPEEVEGFVLVSSRTFRSLARRELAPATRGRPSEELNE